MAPAEPDSAGASGRHRRPGPPCGKDGAHVVMRECPGRCGETALQQQTLFAFSPCPCGTS